MAIKRLETRGLTIFEYGEIQSEVKNAVESANGDVGEKIRNKYWDLMNKNPGFSKIRQIGQVLGGNFIENFEMSPEIVSCYKYANLTSVDVERSFSIYKTVLTDRRTSFSPEIIEMFLVGKKMKTSNEAAFVVIIFLFE